MKPSENQDEENDMWTYDTYRASNEHRREELTRDWRPLRGRRGSRDAVRNQIDGTNRGLAS